MAEQYFRKDTKWAKVSGSRGKWASARGWKGDFQAVYLNTYPTKLGAVVAAKNWIADQ